MSRIDKLFNKNKNRSGGESFSSDIKERYIQTLLTNTMTNTFYLGSGELLDQSKELHARMVYKDPSFVKKALVYARNKGSMRSQPILGLAYLSTIEDKSYFRDSFHQVIRTPNDLLDFVTIVGTIRDGRGLGRSIKREINKYLNTLDEYRAIKYSGSRSGKWSLRDVIKATHPKPDDSLREKIFAYLVKNKISKSMTQILCFEALKKLNPNYDHYEENVIYLIEKGRLPYESVTGIIKPTPKIWEYLMREMPMFALIRHLNVFEKNDILNSNDGYLYKRLIGDDEIIKSKVLPFRFATAINSADYDNALVDKGLEMAIETSFQNIDPIEGKSIWFLDSSSSMSQRYMEVGTILGMAGLKNSSTSKLIQFTNKLQLPKLTKNTPIKNALDEVMRNYGGGTITHSCIDFLLGNKGQVSFDTFFPQKLRLTKPLKVDNIIIITDEKQNPGSKFYKKLMEYKTKINPKVKTFIIDVSPYGDRLTPPDIEDVFYIYGWNTSVLNLISYGVKGYDKCLEEVESQ